MGGAVIGAVFLIGEILRRGDGLEVMLTLDHYGIYESDIWILYKYICDCSIPALCGLNLSDCIKDMIADIKSGRAVDAVLKIAGQAEHHGF